jgi:peptide/nickel transport system substrate-binding protein
MNPDTQEHQPHTIALFRSRAISALSPKEQKFFWIISTFCAIASIILLLQVADHFMSEVPRYGGSFTEGTIGFPRHINPVIARTDTDKDLSALIYSGLVRKTSEGTFIPDLAESITKSEDGKTYTVKLRENIHFHDGAPVTSNDVAFTINAMVDSAREIKGTRRASWEGVTVETPDPSTVVFTLPSPYAPFIEQLSMGILPAHLWSSLPREQFDLSNLNLRPIGTGPYMIKNVTLRGDGIPVEYTLRAFDDFSLGRPYIKDIVIRFYGNRDELLSAYNTGDILAMSDVDPALGETLARDGH